MQVRKSQNKSIPSIVASSYDHAGDGGNHAHDQSQRVQIDKVTAKWCIQGGLDLRTPNAKKTKDKTMESPSSLLESEDQENRMQNTICIAILKTK